MPIPYELWVLNLLPLLHQAILAYWENMGPYLIWICDLRITPIKQYFNKHYKYLKFGWKELTQSCQPLEAQISTQHLKN